MKDFLFTREDDVIYQYCPEGESNVLIAPKENDVLMASQNPAETAGTAQGDIMPYKCVAYCTGESFTGMSTAGMPTNDLTTAQQNT